MEAVAHELAHVLLDSAEHDSGFYDEWSRIIPLLTVERRKAL